MAPLYLIDRLNELAEKLAESAKLAHDIASASYTHGMNCLRVQLDTTSTRSDELSVTIDQEIQRIANE